MLGEAGEAGSELDRLDVVEPPWATGILGEDDEVARLDVVEPPYATGRLGEGETVILDDIDVPEVGEDILFAAIVLLP